MHVDGLTTKNRQQGTKNVKTGKISQNNAKQNFGHELVL